MHTVSRTGASYAFEGYVHDGIIAAMKLSALGEFELIELIKIAVRPTDSMPSETAARIVLGIGDDTAAWTGSELIQLATTDSLVEDVHFQFRWCTWEDLGHKSMAVNLSDIAAMGGRPRFALVSLSCPGDVDSDQVLEYYRGMTRLASQHDVVIIGGNLTSSPIVVSTVCVTGEAVPNRILTRGAARPGDAIAVTGTLGAAAAAVALLRDGAVSAGQIPTSLLRALVRPEARLADARTLVDLGVRCAIDISDGLLSDLGHICECSGVSAVLYAAQLPVAADSADDAEGRTKFALTGGEDYELIFACAASLIPEVSAALSCPVTVVGEVTFPAAGPAVTVLGSDGLSLDIAKPGWRHFSP